MNDSRVRSKCQLGIHEAGRVLILDDNFSLADNIAEILQLDGHLTDIAASAEEAFPMALESEPDVVVTDYRLPGISGVDFVKKVRRTWTGLLAVVVSAYTDERTVNASRDAGATFMAKPIDFEILTGLVREASA
jgi:DNA-binding NtrC family response regulator